MARKFLTPIDLNKLELQNAVIQNLATDPESPAQGQIYYNSVSDILKVYDGAAWFELGSISTESVQDIVNGVIVAGSGVSSTYNDSSNTLTIANTGVTSLTGTADEVTVSAASGAVTVSLPATINANTTGTAASLTTARNIALTGDVTGTVSFDGSASASMATTIAANSVALGTDTTGNYVATIAGTANEIEVSGSGSETASVTIGLPDDVTIGNLTVSGALTVSGSATYVNTEIVTINDNIVVLNNTEAGTPSANAGIEVERGTSTNVSVLWNETSDTWTLSNDGTNFHGITRKHSASIGDGAATSIAVTHNLNTRDVTVDVYSNSTYDTVDLDIVRTDANTVTVTFAVAPASNAYRVVIVG
jgi:cytoskeletal protein CcmA (bactofilin family)